MSKNIIASLIQIANDLDNINFIKYADEITQIAEKIAQTNKNENPIETFQEDLEEQRKNIEENLENLERNRNEYNQRLREIKNKQSEFAKKKNEPTLQNSEELIPKQLKQMFNPNNPQTLV